MLKQITHFRYHKAWGLLLLRAATGLVFLNHGWMKMNDLTKYEGFFGTLGLPPGAATFVAVVEVVGGIMLILGIAPRIAALVLGVLMIVALGLVGIPNGTHELEMMLAAASLAIFMIGAGRLSLYNMERE
jgi:putative oxidoreductase